LPREPAKLATAFTETTRRLRGIGWDGTNSVPDDVTHLALHHQRILRLMAERRALGDATLRALPNDVKGEARDTVLARRDIDAIPRGKPPTVRVAEAAPATDLKRYYDEAQKRFGIDWSTLAAINFVESAFGRVRSASEAGAKGPMQFLPSTWAAYGRGDIDDPRDAILAAARYLKAHGGGDRALFAYNHSAAYVRAVKRFARRMHRDERVFRTYYAWQVYVRTPNGGSRRITGPGRA
jgi:membrane-bound lytic murein transglycosylase B